MLKPGTYAQNAFRAIAKENYAHINIVKSSIAGNKFISTYDGLNLTLDSIYEKSNTFIGGIPLTNILRHDSSNVIHAILYTDYSLGDDYWIAISKDKGRSWDKYCTGLTEDQQYHVKLRSFIPFIKNDSIIQFEVALLKMTDPGILPSRGPTYQLVTDNLVIEIDLHRVRVDTDHDGITDIMERKLLLNPESKDTDHDGINDYTDHNPLYKGVHNKYTALYTSLLENESKRIIPFYTKKPGTFTKELHPDPETYFVITEDKNLRKILGTNNTYIFLTREELTRYYETYPEAPSIIYISPLVPVKGKRNQFEISIDYKMGGKSYLITEEKDRWSITSISGWDT